MIRVLLADDQGLVRAGFKVLLESAADIEVVGEAANGEEALAQAREKRPDVVLMDIRMPKLDGLEATRRIVGDRELSGVRVLILTTFEVDEYVFEALRSGASGFVVKDIEPSELLQAVRVVARGDALLSPGVTRRLIAEFAGRPGQRRLTTDSAGQTVYSGRHTETGRPYAVKLLLPDESADDEAAKNFRRAALATAHLNTRVDHQHVAKTYDYGLLSDGAVYVVTEMVGGRSLRRTHCGGSKCERCEQNRAKEGLSSPHCIPPKCRRVGGASRSWCTIKSLAALISRVNHDDSALRVAIPQAAT